eukprot:TRINITY_DN31078_c0_g1_i1.p1 TRINITY_DN31078_c0_g1~~TRINITY_DN31078_c0_g1_i1.p1  ORF type:complete len:328 (+),score=89.71 TRINITY_DN31078_c0_g1_i1:76-1059(+)
MVCFPGMPLARSEATVAHQQQPVASSQPLRRQQRRRLTLAANLVAAVSAVSLTTLLARRVTAFLGAPAPHFRDGMSLSAASMPTRSSRADSLTALQAWPFEGDQAAEDGTAVAEAPPPDSATESASEDDAAPAEFGPLFQELYVSNSTVPKKLMKAIVGVFGHGDRAVDLVLVDSRCKDTLMYAICSLPSQFRATAQVLLRRRDRRLRLRVFRDAIPSEEEPSPEVLYLGKQTNASSLGFAIKSRFVDQVGNNRKKTVKLDFAGREAASRALVAIESAMHFAHRELVFRPRFEWKDSPAAPAEPAEGAEGGAGKGQQVRIGVTVTAI